MTNPRHPNPIHENQSFPWAERQNPNLIHENRPFPWAERRRCEKMLRTCAMIEMQISDYAVFIIKVWRRLA